MRRLLICVLTLAATVAYSAIVRLNGSTVMLNGKAVDLSASVTTYYYGQTLACLFNGTNTVGFVCANGSDVMTNNPNMSTGATQTNFIPNNYTGQAVRLDGVDDYLQGPARIQNGSTALTMCVWVWSTNYAKSTFLFAESGSAGERVNGFSEGSTTTQLLWRMSGTSNGTTVITNVARVSLASPLSTGVWHCLIGTWNSNAIPALYVDGISANTQLTWTAGLVVTGATATTYLGYNPLTAVFFPGYFANVWVTNVYVSSNTAYNLYNTGNL